jgi:hypothetical protein
MLTGIQEHIEQLKSSATVPRLPAASEARRLLRAHGAKGSMGPETQHLMGTREPKGTMGHSRGKGPGAPGFLWKSWSGAPRSFFCLNLGDDGEGGRVWGGPGPGPHMPCVCL